MENLEQRLKELHKDIILDICMNVNNCASWYDPEEDRENGEQDDCTGFNYVRLE